MKVSIDQGLCCGNLECVRIAPDLFKEGPAGLGIVILSDVPEAAQGRAVEAAQSCPAGAVLVDRGG